MSENLLNQFKEIHNEQKIDADKKVRVGIIGTGWIASGHMTAYLERPDVELVAVADLVEGKAEAFLEKHGAQAKVYRSHKEMLDDESLQLDAVSVCTYNRTHAECTIYALQKGVNVLLEKPMCVTVEEAAAIVRAEKESGKIVSLGFQPRLDENMKMIKKIVQSGKLGQVYYIQTGGGRRRGIPVPFGTSFIEDATAGIGAVGDIGCYSLDMVLNAIGYPKPLTVSGYKSNFFGVRPDYCTYVAQGKPEYAEKFQVDDFAAAFVRLEGGIILDFRIAWAMNIDTPGDTIILGTEGGLRIPSTDCWNGSVGGEMTLYQEVCGQQTETKIPIIQTKGDVFSMKVFAFIDAVKNGDPAPVPASEILYNQAIIDGIVKSAALGKEIEIEMPEI